MKKELIYLALTLCVLFPFCNEKKGLPSKALVDALDLKRGAIISCGNSNMRFGVATMDINCSKEATADFNLALSLLHSFEYEEAEKAFAKVIDKDPGCAMAYWGVAMSNFHPLWTPPSQPELEKGEKAAQLAQSLSTSKRETAYIDAIVSFYHDWKGSDHRTRCLAFEQGMKKVYDDYPEDIEAAVFYALALDAAADPADKAYTKQKKAGTILTTLYAKNPDHPGIVHYIIHTYDYPELAQQALGAARRYASVAPSSAHALHMPSHIFTRLGLWEEAINSNIASVAAAQCYAAASGIKGHWDEELHGLDYLMYAYLQEGASDSAKKQLDYLMTMREVHPANFKVAYAFAAIPCRWVLENKLWKEAAVMEAPSANFSWQNYPWQEAIIQFTRLLGCVHTNNLPAAETALEALNRIHDTLLTQKDAYKANQVAIQISAARGWISLQKGNGTEALLLMQQAASMEDSTGKHPVTPGEVVPARELLGDMLLQMNKPAEALKAYQGDLKTHPNRFNALYGAAVAAERAGDNTNAHLYYQQLVTVTHNGATDRPEVKKAKEFLKAPAAS